MAVNPYRKKKRRERKKKGGIKSIAVIKQNKKCLLYPL